MLGQSWLNELTYKDTIWKKVQTYRYTLTKKITQLQVTSAHKQTKIWDSLWFAQVEIQIIFIVFLISSIGENYKKKWYDSRDFKLLTCDLNFAKDQLLKKSNMYCSEELSLILNCPGQEVPLEASLVVSKLF